MRLYAILLLNARQATPDERTQFAPFKSTDPPAPRSTNNAPDPHSSAAVVPLTKRRQPAPASLADDTQVMKAISRFLEKISTGVRNGSAPQCAARRQSLP
jgi:hypothetical protein